MSRSLPAGRPTPDEAGPRSGVRRDPPQAVRDDATARPLSLLGRIRQWWSRVLAKPSFQKWTAAFPLTRPVAPFCRPGAALGAAECARTRERHPEGCSGVLRGQPTDAGSRVQAARASTSNRASISASEL